MIFSLDNVLSMFIKSQLQRSKECTKRDENRAQQPSSPAPEPSHRSLVGAFSGRTLSNTWNFCFTIFPERKFEMHQSIPAVPIPPGQ